MNTINENSKKHAREDEQEPSKQVIEETIREQDTPPIKKKKLAEKNFDYSITDRPYNGPRRFALNGALFVGDNNIFKVSFSEWNEQFLIPKILLGKEYYLLVYPSQAGKTTRVLELMNQLREMKFMRKKGPLMKQIEKQEDRDVSTDKYDTDIELLPLYVDMSGIRKAKGDTLNELEQSAWSHFIAELNNNEGLIKSIDATKYSSFSRLFHNSSLNELFGGKYPVLFLDEIDALESLDEKSSEIIISKNFTETTVERVRKTFLLELRSIKHNPHSHCLQFLLGISNYMGDYTQIVGGSPFNISDLLYGSYFTKEQVEDLVLQYETQEQIQIDKRIVEDIFERTLGHPGQTIILFMVYHNNRQDTVGGSANDNNNDGLPNLQKWLQVISSDDFLRKLGGIANFQRIKSTIDREVLLQPELIRWILNRKLYLNDKIVSKLQQGQIVREIPYSNKFLVRVDFVTPLVRQYICTKLQDKAKIVMNEIPYQHNGKIDFLKIIEAVVQQLNRWALITGDTKRNDTTRLIENSNEEQEFDSAFYASLEAVVKKARIRQQLLISKLKTDDKSLIPSEFHKQKPDLFIEFADKGQKIIVEHCANVNMNPNSIDKESLAGHVKKTQKYYEISEAESAFVIHWTNVSSSASPHKYWYTHKDAPNVNIVYIYYDPLFFRFEIHYGDNKVIVVQNEKSLFPKSSPKVLYVRVGKDGKKRGITLTEHNVHSLVSTVRERFADVSEIKNGNFELSLVTKDDLLPLDQDAAIAKIVEDSILQIDLTV